MHTEHAYDAKLPELLTGLRAVNATAKRVRAPDYLGIRAQPASRRVVGGAARLVQVASPSWVLRMAGMNFA